MADETDTETDEPLASVLMELTEALEPIVDAVVGHRKALVEAGFGDEAADEMAANYHAALIDVVLGGDCVCD